MLINKYMIQFKGLFTTKYACLTQKVGCYLSMFYTLLYEKYIIKRNILVGSGRKDATKKQKDIK